MTRYIMIFLNNLANGVQSVTDASQVRLSTLSLALGLFILVILYKRHQYNRRKNLPPGPWGWPIIGILPTLATGDPAKKLIKIGKTYGDIFSFRLGSYDVVVLNNFDLIKEAFQRSGDIFMDRPRQTMFELFTHGQGIATGFYERHHKQLRKFFLRTMRNLGFAKAESEQQIRIIAQHLAVKFASHAGKPFNPRHEMELSASNISCTHLFGKTFPPDDKGFQKCVTLNFAIFETCGAAGYVNLFPGLIHLPISTNRKLKQWHHQVLEEFYQPIIDEHLKTLDVNTGPRDLMDAFLLEIKNNEHNPEPNPFNMTGMLDLMGDLFAASSDTTTTASRWILLLMVKYPEVQKRIQDELDDIVGRQRMPDWSDRINLHYLQAAIVEGLRLTCIGPFGVAHSPIEDTQLRGYDIPKEAVVLPLLFGVMHDPKVFPEPDQYRPERFLDVDGCFKTHENFTLFGVGKRACVGEQLARMELFYFITFILHQMNLSSPVGPDNVSMDRVQGLSVNPVDYEIITEKRVLDLKH